MDKHRRDIGMDRGKISARTGGAGLPVYALTAAILWALVFYSLSPVSKAEPARLASRAIQLCEQVTP